MAQGITQLQEIAKEHGVERDSILNQSQYFSVADGIPPDIMHDILEGITILTHISCKS